MLGSVPENENKKIIIIFALITLRHEIMQIKLENNRPPESARLIFFFSRTQGENETDRYSSKEERQKKTQRQKDVLCG